VASITIQAASVANGVLNLTYARDGDGGNGIQIAVADLIRHEIELSDIDLIKFLLTWFRRRGGTAGQLGSLVGRTVTFDATLLRNVIAVT
jgi:hypothetical protein